MDTRADITPELLRQLLRYEPETGKLFWKPRTPDMFQEGAKSQAHQCAAWNAKWADKQTFLHSNNRGYIAANIMGFGFLAHRVAWAISHGRWPIGEIDHVNRDRADNRISNLRDVNHAENCSNSGPMKRSKSGHRGVHFCPKRNKWIAQLVVNGTHHWLGAHETKQQAIDARAKGYSTYCSISISPA